RTEDEGRRGGTRARERRSLRDRVGTDARERGRLDVEAGPASARRGPAVACCVRGVGGGGAGTDAAVRFPSEATVCRGRRGLAACVAWTVRLALPADAVPRGRAGTFGAASRARHASVRRSDASGRAGVSSVVAAR